MEKFNNTTLFTGYLKQLLHNFNLPKYKVYTKEHRKYYEKYGREREDIYKTTTKYLAPIKDNAVIKYYPDTVHYVPYIKNGSIQEYVNGKWCDTSALPGKETYHASYYNDGMKILNHTKNLKITTNSYDYYTHEYLGDYLRFQRDYYDIDLMPLYNCFNDRQCDLLDISWEVAAGNNKIDIVFNTKDQNYKIYMIPIKLFKEYTIAIDSELPIEMCCGLYSSRQDKRAKFADLPKATYKKVLSTRFSSPFLYSKLALTPKNVSEHSDYLLKTLTNNRYYGADPEKFLAELAQNESALKLFLKVPQANNSTIVILEGNYIGWNDYATATSDTKTTIKVNHTVINFENIQEEDDLPLITPLQLLRFNTGEQYPFADRLIEYLTGNAITSIDEITQNIARVQKAMINRTVCNQAFDADKIKEYKNANKKLPPVYQYYYKNKGFWDNYIRYIAYDYMNNTEKTQKFAINHDILGYIDKDVEKYYSYIDQATKISTSISNTEIAPEEEI